MDAGVGVSAALVQQNTISTEARRPSGAHPCSGVAGNAQLSKPANSSI
jgi:hypothetical protein